MRLADRAIDAGAAATERVAERAGAALELIEAEHGRAARRRRQGSPEGEGEEGEDAVDAEGAHGVRHLQP